MQTFTIDKKTVCVFPGAEPTAPIIYLNTFSDEGQKIYEAALAAGCPAFTLVAISDLDWNRDMSPWDSPPVFKGAGPCTGGADDYLRFLSGEIVPKAEKELAGVRYDTADPAAASAWVESNYDNDKASTIIGDAVFELSAPSEFARILIISKKPEEIQQ